MKDTVLDLSFQDYLERMNPQSSFQEQLVVIYLDDSVTKKDKVGRYPMQLEASSCQVKCKLKWIICLILLKEVP